MISDPATENQTPQLPNKFACDFESGITLCGLQQMDSDKFDWTRHQGRTRSRGTGPSADNTLVILFRLFISLFYLSKTLFRLKLEL